MMLSQDASREMAEMHRVAADMLDDHLAMIRATKFNGAGLDPALADAAADIPLLPETLVLLAWGHELRGVARMRLLDKIVATLVAVDVFAVDDEPDGGGGGMAARLVQARNIQTALEIGAIGLDTIADELEPALGFLPVVAALDVMSSLELAIAVAWAQDGGRDAKPRPIRLLCHLHRVAAAQEVMRP